MHAPPTYAVVIVGARCAGAATALLLARRGYDVALVDKSPMPQDTLSTHAIARSGIVQLSRWGLLDRVRASGAPPIRSVAFGTAASLTTRTVKPTAGVDLLLAPRRYVLDTILREAAIEAGATLYTPATVRDVIRHPSGRITGVTIGQAGGRRTLSGRIVVGADGLRSTVADRVGAPYRWRSISSSGTFYTYARGMHVQGFEFHLAPRALVGLFPTHFGETCVWICAPDDSLRPLLRAGSAKTAVLQQMIDDAAPQLAGRVQSAEITAPVRGAVNLPSHIRHAAGPGWALVGDAAYHRDPITGHGISDAFRDAELLTGAIDAHLGEGAPWSQTGSAYDTARTAAAQQIFTITQALTEFPSVGRFIELQKRLSDAIEDEALDLAARPSRHTTPVLVA